MSDYSKIYPYNVIPQYRTAQPSSPAPCLKCPPDESLQSIIFDCGTLSVIKGFQWKSNIELKDIFVPCEQYLEYEFIIKTNDPASFITLNYGNLSNPLKNNGTEFVAIIPVYHTTALETQDLWWLNFRFVGETTWRKLGRFFMWSATIDTPVPPIELQNISGEDITLKILIGQEQRM